MLQPTVTPADHATHGLQQLMSALQVGTSSRSSEQLHAIQSLQDTLAGWTRNTAPVARTDRLSDDQKMWADRQLAPPTPRVPSPSPTEGTQPLRVLARPDPRVPKQTAPRVQEPPLLVDTQPVAHRTRSARAQAPTSDPTTVSPTATTQPVAQRTCSRYSLAANLLTALPVLDEDSGKLLEHRQLCRHPRLKETWDTSYANELGRLC